MSPAAERHRVRVVEPRGEFVTDHQEGRMPADGTAVHQQAVVRRGGEGL